MICRRRHLNGVARISHIYGWAYLFEHTLKWVLKAFILFFHSSEYSQQLQWRINLILRYSPADILVQISGWVEKMKWRSEEEGKISQYLFEDFHLSLSVWIWSWNEYQSIKISLVEIVKTEKRTQIKFLVFVEFFSCENWKIANCKNIFDCW